MSHRVLFVLAMGVGVLWLADSASAQIGSNEVVFGTGKIRLQPTPNKLRMQVELRSYGLTVDAALESLKARRAAATAQLQKLNADAASICFSTARAGLPQTIYATAVLSPAVSYATPIAPSYAPYPQVPAPAIALPSAAATPSFGQSAAPGNNPPAKPRPQLFVAATTLKADWLLLGADADEIVAAAEAIRQRGWRSIWWAARWRTISCRRKSKNSRKPKCVTPAPSVRQPCHPQMRGSGPPSSTWLCFPISSVRRCLPTPMPRPRITRPNWRKPPE